MKSESHTRVSGGQPYTLMSRKKMDLWFGAEAKAILAIDNARASSNWEVLATEIDKLLEARLQKVKAARNGKRVRLVQCREEAELISEGGRYLVQPPLVARDAALLDNALKMSGNSSVIACREPITSLGLCPIVALGSGVTVRVQVEKPTNPTRPTCAWFDYALEELGNHVLEQLDKISTEQRQLDYLLAHLPAIPTHVGAHRAAIERCVTLARSSV